MPLMVLLPNKTTEFTELEAYLTCLIYYFLKIKVVLKRCQILLHSGFAVFVVLFDKVCESEPLFTARKRPIDRVMQTRRMRKVSTRLSLVQQCRENTLTDCFGYRWRERISYLAVLRSLFARELPPILCTPALNSGNHFDRKTRRFHEC